jgi:hypothetical protein
MARPEYQHEVKIILKTDADATIIQWGRITQKLLVNGIPRIRQDVRFDPDQYLSNQLMALMQTVSECIKTTGRQPITFPPENTKKR